MISMAITSGVVMGQSSAGTFLPSNQGNKTLLWEVSGGNLIKPSYFLGTMHILCPEDAFLSPAVQQILDTVEAVYFELDLDNMGLMMAAMKNMAMLNDTTLSDLLTTEELDILKTALADKIPFPFQVLERFKPMLISGLLAEQMLPCKAGAGTEMLIMEEASKRKLRTEGLETPAYQFSLFDLIPYGEQAKSLLKSLDTLSKEGEKVVGEMLTAFQQQDLEELARLTQSEESGLEGYEDLLLNNRNRNWVEKFVELSAQSTNLYAVGAGHLPGEIGVLKLLEQKGYKLRPLLNQKAQ
jgi:uncharacterized protein YbaP (TraB family)